MSKFEHLDLHLFNLYLRFELILHTVYNIAIAVAQNDFLKADLNKLWNPYCVNTWTFIWHNPVSNQLLGQRFVGYFVWPALADDVGPTTCCSSNQRHAQQLAQRCSIFIDPTRHTKCQHVINHLKQNIR